MPARVSTNRDKWSFKVEKGVSVREVDRMAGEVLPAGRRGQLLIFLTLIMESSSPRLTVTRSYVFVATLRKLLPAGRACKNKFGHTG